VTVGPSSTGLHERDDQYGFPAPSSPTTARHPTSHNTEWRAVLSLLEVVGSAEECHDGDSVVTLGSETETLERPNDKDIDTQQVIDLRRMLRNAGYGPDVGQAEVWA
jgi:hypothetical protein